jgi:hypothetical protein
LGSFIKAVAHGTLINDKKQTCSVRVILYRRRTYYSEEKCQTNMEIFQYARVRADDSSQAPLQVSAQSICDIMSA